MSKARIIITGGGTGGHVFPAISIAKELQLRGIPVLYIGSPQGMEATLAPKNKIPFFALKGGQIKNQGIRTLLGLWVTFMSTLKMVVYFLKDRPKAVLTVGGYIGVPASVAAFCLRIPVFIQEQNASVGIANRFLGKFAKKVFVGFEQAIPVFGEKKCVVSGNPVRKEFFRADFPRPKVPPTHLFVFGGSQGARAINEAVCKLLPKLLARFPHLEIFHQTGQKDLLWVKDHYAKVKGAHQVEAFVENMVQRYEWADLVLSRSGAMTVSELAVVGRPSILVPYPRRGQNDQLDNARYLERLGVSRMVPQGDAFLDRLWETLLESLDTSPFQAQLTAFDSLQRKNALATIGNHLESAV